VRVSERQKLDALTRIRKGATGGGTLVFVRTKTGARDFPNGSMPVATP